MWQSAPLLFAVLLALGCQGQIFSYQPEQVHLSFGSNVSEVVVSWTTYNDTQQSWVEYGIGGMILSAQGSSIRFVDGGEKKRVMYFHKVSLKGLMPEKKYVYHCGSNLGWSPQFWFNTVPQHSDWAPHLAIYGDMGNENAQSLVRLQEETQRGMYDAILHVGDFAYDMHTNDAEVGDAFMRQIESVAAYLPYMTCPGNHEEKYNFSNYKYRFNMPTGNENIMYSFNLGPVHVISVSTEAYYFMNYGIKQLVNQYEWLVNDLKEANEVENRKERPWIILMGHRPMYCSNADTDDCTHHETLTRVGLPFLHFFGLEELLYLYGVDVVIWAHEHSYERLWPVYNYKVYNGSYEEPYVDPKAPVHIVTGSAGCKEKTDQFNATRPAWSAFSNSDYGYTRMKAHNKTHLYMEQVSDNKQGAIVDSFWLVKNYHGSYKDRNNKSEL